MHNAAHHDTDARSDRELADAVRGHDTDAFSVLYARHYRAAYQYARLWAAASDRADDLVVEAFRQVLRRLRAGGGPTIAFRTYLITTIRTLGAAASAEDHY
jgi:DNA-directed RNA polymerase specialized sigma24 family protein